ncbi:MAG TPA: tetraacyldisaccharide 4'-kinase [Candidatus Eisenbacteria bacterium]|nr:tetraacyldisaccharide 4'-kinase [Candidatus Eisenbacteria bacterium]
MSRDGIVGAIERSWSGLPGSVPWTAAFLPVAGAYAIAAGFARARASRTRTTVAGMHVVSVGNLTVGGTGKSSLARWLAREAADAGRRCAVLLRGHGASAALDAPSAVPDFSSYPLVGGAGRYGDEALAHRAALPRSVAVIVDRDRRRAADAARFGYGASAAILDDGWEQGALAWDELWVLLDPHHPLGNGYMLPAGPLRRPASALEEATVIALILESEEEQVPDSTLKLAARLAPRAPVVRFRRTFLGVSPIGSSDLAPWTPADGPAGLLTAVGSPGRVERFAAGAGISVRRHESLPDHASASPSTMIAALMRLRLVGATVALVTDKDEHRWVFPDPSPLPVRVLRTGLRPLDAVSALLAPLRGSSSPGVC